MTSLNTMDERDYFSAVGKRPGMFVGRPSFRILIAFLLGYDQNAARHGTPGLAGWPEWLVARRGKECNHAWPGQVLHLALPDGWQDIWNLSPDEDARAVEVLFDLLDEFFADRENDGSARTSQR